MSKQTFTTVANIKARRALTCDELGVCNGVCDGQNCFGATEREQAGNYHPHLQEQEATSPWAGLSEWVAQIACKASIGALVVLAVGGAAGYAWGKWLT